MKRFYHFFSAFLVIVLLSSFLGFGSHRLQAHTEKKHFKEQNKRKCHKKGPKRFMLSQKAKKAVIKKHPEDVGSFLIEFSEVEPFVTYYKVEPNRNFGILTLKQYMWYCHFGKSMFSKDNPRGALGYLSFDEKSEEGILNFSVFQLNKPQYDKKKQILSYQLDPIDGFKVEPSEHQEIILTIDLTVN